MPLTLPRLLHVCNKHSARARRNQNAALRVPRGRESLSAEHTEHPSALRVETLLATEDAEVLMT
jgi:hypothetical protein